MDAKRTNPYITKAAINQLPISGINLGKLLQDVLANDTKIRFRATGNSMKPFILDGDLLTIVPISQCKPTIGMAVAFLHPDNQCLLVHRIISIKVSAFLIKGDNIMDKNDGWIPISQILGCVTAVQRRKHAVHIGLGVERYLLAFLSKNNLLKKITNRMSIFFE